MKVVDFLSPEAIITALGGTSKSEVLAEMATLIASQPNVSSAIDAEGLRRALEAREQLGSTALADGIAFPHGKLDNLECLVGALGHSPAGLAFDSLDGKPTHLVFVLVTPASSPSMHLEALSRLSRLFRDAGFRQRLSQAADGATMYRTIVEEDAKL
jgi:mannitol/fructose-specific phosphotransferase system IIA component (Ntr-type)